jgi:hypothetical protein
MPSKSNSWERVKGKIDVFILKFNILFCGIVLFISGIVDLQHSCEYSGSFLCIAGLALHPAPWKSLNDKLKWKNSRRIQLTLIAGLIIFRIIAHLMHLYSKNR